MGTAQIQGELWGSKAEDWSELQEPAWTPVFEKVLSLAGVQRGITSLDVGCGAGGALVIARKRGADVAGIDGSKNLVEIARRRLPGARIEIGDMEELPFADGSFDVVTGVNSFQFAEDPARALAEARRVCRRDGIVFLLTWARPEDCQLMNLTMRSVVALLPAPPPGSKSPGPMIDPAVLESLIRKAGLEPIQTDQFASELVFPDASTAVRAVMSAGVIVRAARLVGEDVIAKTIRATLPAVTRKDGSVAWSNRFLWVKTRPQKT